MEQQMNCLAGDPKYQSTRSFNAVFNCCIKEAKIETVELN